MTVQTLHGANDTRFDRFACSITYKLRKVTCIANIESLQPIFKFYEIAAHHVVPQTRSVRPQAEKTELDSE